MAEPYNGNHQDKIFNDNFVALSFHNEGNKLKAVELEIHREAGAFLLSMMTMDIYTSRAGEQDEDDDNQVYVIPADEILPSDLITVRDAPDEVLKDFLVPQAA